ncbi:MAG TPA: MAPEG family protein [Burkholderiaceae bacterium]|nr:MAPEG family protein [Burkholderiaceae bacterium]
MFFGIRSVFVQSNEQRLSGGSPLRLKAAAFQMAVAILVAAAVWWGCFQLLSPIAGTDLLIDRLVFALKCASTAILLTFLTGIEAVAHERFTSAAFDPLAGKESHRLLIDLRYLQNTLEQIVLFVPGLLLLAAYSDGGSAMRAVVATTLVWMLARIAFWIGYHIGAQQRVAGLVGTAQSMIVLLYVCARFGYEVAGAWGAAVPLTLFALAEAVLVVLARRQ